MRLPLLRVAGVPQSVSVPGQLELVDCDEQDGSLSAARDLTHRLDTANEFVIHDTAIHL
jgi:hypothetical protein